MIGGSKDGGNPQIEIGERRCNQHGKTTMNSFNKQTCFSHLQQTVKEEKRNCSYCRRSRNEILSRIGSSNSALIEVFLRTTRSLTNEFGQLSPLSRDTNSLFHCKVPPKNECSMFSDTDAEDTKFIISLIPNQSHTHNPPSRKVL